MANNKKKKTEVNKTFIRTGFRRSKIKGHPTRRFYSLGWMRSRWEDNRGSV